jgi:hypothetical protein
VLPVIGHLKTPREVLTERRPLAKKERPDRTSAARLTAQVLRQTISILEWSTWCRKFMIFLVAAAVSGPVMGRTVIPIPDTPMNRQFFWTNLRVRAELPWQAPSGMGFG